MSDTLQQPPTPTAPPLRDWGALDGPGSMGDTSPAPVPVDHKRNILVFLVSIVLIIGAVLGAFLGFVVMAGSSDADSPGLAVMLGLVEIAVAAFQLVVGITGVRNAANPDKGQTLYTMGGVLLAVDVVIIVITFAAGGGFNYQSLIGCLWPIMLMSGASKLKQQCWLH